MFGTILKTLMPLPRHNDNIPYSEGIPNFNDYQSNFNF